MRSLWELSMKFKEFMLMEDGGGGGGEGEGDFFGNYLYPSDAFDWSDFIGNPQAIAFIEKRWKRDHDSGRKFHNIDYDGVQNTRFDAVHSETMPDGEKKWVHEPDSRPNLKVSRGKMRFLGVGKTADMHVELTKEMPHLDRTSEFNKLFGEFKPKYPTLSGDFDKPWKRKYERK